MIENNIYLKRLVHPDETQKAYTGHNSGHLVFGQILGHS